jgi:hypothetical protein
VVDLRAEEVFGAAFLAPAALGAAFFVAVFLGAAAFYMKIMSILPISMHTCVIINPYLGGFLGSGFLLRSSSLLGGSLLSSSGLLSGSLLLRGSQYLPNYNHLSSRENSPWLS